MVVAVQKAADAPAASRHYLLSGRVRLCFVSRKTRENGPEMASALLLFCEPSIINPISLIVPMCHWDWLRWATDRIGRPRSSSFHCGAGASKNVPYDNVSFEHPSQYLSSRLINEFSVGLKIVFQLSDPSINIMNRNSIQDLGTIQTSSQSFPSLICQNVPADGNPY